MSDIPEETVKAVATALQEACKGQFGTYWSNDIAAHFARAALKSSGWAEMKEALEEALPVVSEHSGRVQDIVENALAVRKP